MSSSEQIIRRKLSDEIFDRLKTIILGGELKIGDTLPSERDLMERFGVGRPAIREAMHALSNLGLISISHGERARVCALTPASLFRQIDLPAQLMLSGSSQSLHHLLDARLFFERGMVRAAAESASKTEVTALRQAIKRQAAMTDDITSFIEQDMEFHVMIAASARNPIFEAVCRAMLGWLRSYHTEMLHWTGKENVTIAEHAEIVDCIAAHDPEKAEATMIKHLQRSSTLYVHQTDRPSPDTAFTAKPARRAAKSSQRA